VRVAFPWQNAPQVRVKVEITHDEPVLLPAPERTIIHGYGELGEEAAFADVRVKTYALEEIVAEKLRTLRQTQQRLEVRGWNRPRARDYYDLWRILALFGSEIDAAAVRRILPAKMALRSVDYSALDDFFTEQLVSEARRHWQSNLGTFVASLPDVELVLAELRPLLATLLALS
jgi:predicted nucleotidyltransferase component of viral defense system